MCWSNEGAAENSLVSYEIRDIVDNYSLKSQPATVNLNFDPNALPSPLLLNADEQTNPIDLVRLGSDDAQVLVSTAMLLRDDAVYLTWVGRTLIHSTAKHISHRPSAAPAKNR